MSKILVVDDDDDILDTIQLILEIGGHDIQALNNAEAVLETIRDFKPDLVLLDVVLGKLDGRTICEQLRTSAETAHIPILMMSGLYDMGDIREMQHPPHDFISKPFKIDVLLEKIGTLSRKKADHLNIN